MMQISVQIITTTNNECDDYYYHYYHHVYHSMCAYSNLKIWWKCTTTTNYFYFIFWIITHVYKIYQSKFGFKANCVCHINWKKRTKEKKMWERQSSLTIIIVPIILDI
mgnify:CR=1 FL=1